jgi:hypothetical protein
MLMRILLLLSSLGILQNFSNINSSLLPSSHRRSMEFKLIKATDVNVQGAPLNVEWQPGENMSVFIPEGTEAMEVICTWEGGRKVPPVKVVASERLSDSNKLQDSVEMKVSSKLSSGTNQEASAAASMTNVAEGGVSPQR